MKKSVVVFTITLFCSGLFFGTVHSRGIQLNFSRVSVKSDGTESQGTIGYSGSYRPSISADGGYIAFESLAGNLVDNDTNSTSDIFVHNHYTGSTERVSISTSGTEGNFYSQHPSISADGKFIAFESYATNLVTPASSSTQVFVRNYLGQTTELISKSSGGAYGNSNSYSPTSNSDGRYVAFTSYATNLIPSDANGSIVDIFLRDRTDNTTELISLNSSEVQGNGYCYNPSISGDGRYIAFDSGATNLITTDANGTFNDIFVRDRTDGTTELISKNTSGTQGYSSSTKPSISADGRYVAFESLSTNLASPDLGGYTDIFVHDRDTGVTEMASVNNDGDQGDGNSSNASISPDGRYVVFISYASNLVSDDNNGLVDTFIRDREQQQTVCLTCAGTSIGGLVSTFSAVVTDKSIVAFNSDREGLVVNDTNKDSDIFLSSPIFGQSNFTLYLPAIINKK